MKRTTLHDVDQNVDSIRLTALGNYRHTAPAEAVSPLQSLG
jgi:hypothetical protein